MQITNNSSGSGVKVNLIKGVSSEAIAEALIRINEQELNIIGYESQTKTYRDETSVLRDNAQVSANNANVSATNANNSALLSTAKANEAILSANNALTYRNEAETFKTNAKASEINADLRATAASTSEVNAKSSELLALQYKDTTLSLKDETLLLKNETVLNTITATEQATISTSNAIIAEQQAQIATTKASESLVNANNAKASELLSAQYKADNESIKINVQTLSNSASDSANTASIKANEASDSAIISTTQANISIVKASEASTYATNSNISAVNALASENNADTSEANALIYRNQAESFANSINPSDLVHISGTETITGNKTFSGTVSGLTKATVGLSNVDNTSDANKPISNEVQTALYLKADKATTLGGYGINDAYTKTSTDSLIDIHSKTEKTTLVDADEFMTADSTSTFSLKKITWANIKNTLASLFISKVTSTDNAVVRFDETTGKVQNSGVIIDDYNNITQNGTGSSQFSLNVGGSLKGWLYSGTSGTALASADYLTFNTNNTERMRIDSAGNVGIGVTPSSWSFGGNIDLGADPYISSSGSNNLLANAYYNAGWKYKSSTQSSRYEQNSGGHTWYTAPSGTAGNAISWNPAMTIDSAGRVTMPYQPAFCVSGLAGTYNGPCTFPFNYFALGVPSQKSINFNTSNGAFTAPISGLYQFNFNIYNFNANDVIYAVFKNGSALVPSDWFQRMSGSVPMTTWSFALYLNSNDYIQMGLRSGAINVYSGHTYFSGYLIG